MSELRLNAVTLAYERARSPVPVLDRLTLGIGKGEFVAVLGQSGSGKTSLLNLAAGFLEPTEGRVTLNGSVVHGPSADRAVVFQDDALYPWLNARDNVAFPLKLRKVAPTLRRERAESLLEDVGLADQGDRHIWELSGGMRQRVGIARALAAEPEYLLMDEPLGALDAMTRDQMQELLLAVWHRSATGALLITHSVEEALFLATRVVVLAAHPGRIVSSLDVSFGRRFLAGEPARALKSEPDFVALREQLISAVHTNEAVAA
ncbi:taurine ABC transporter ATP-binding protein [Devosia riboflavina]